MSFTNYGNKQVNIRLEPEILQKIESKARENNLSPSDWIRNAIRSALGEEIPGAISRLEFEAAIAGLDQRLARLELAGAKQLLAGEVIKPEPKPEQKKVPAKYTPTPKPGEEPELLAEPKKTSAKPKGEKNPELLPEGAIPKEKMAVLAGLKPNTLTLYSSQKNIKLPDGKTYYSPDGESYWMPGQVEGRKTIDKSGGK
jgi:hypothetical protein